MKLGALAMAVLLFGVLSLTGWTNRDATVDAPQLSVQTIDGEAMRIASPSGEGDGRVTLVTFWATSCAVCIEEIPQLAALHQDLAGRGLVLIAVAAHYDVPLNVVRTAERKRIPYPVALDMNRDVARAFDLERTVTPTSFLIDADGRVVLKHTGRMDFTRLRATLEPLLQPA